MQINKIDNVSFGNVFLRDKDCTVDISKIKPLQTLIDRRAEVPCTIKCELIAKIIDEDYRLYTKEPLMDEFKKLVQEQEGNPHHIYIETGHYYDEEIFQRATVGHKVFNQRMYTFEGGAMDFFKKACKYANKLKKLKLDPYIVEISSFENPFITKILSLIIYR